MSPSSHEHSRIAEFRYPTAADTLIEARGFGLRTVSESHFFCPPLPWPRPHTSNPRVGIQAIRRQAPSLGLGLEGRVQLLEDGSFDHVAPRTHLDEFNPAPARKMFDRLKSFSRPTLSILARCTGYNTFILSVMPFSLSYFGLTSKDLNWLRQAASTYILKRKWIEAEILDPYILRYVGITTLLDPALSAAVASLGLYLREGNPLEDLHQLGNDGRCSNRGNVQLSRI